MSNLENFNLENFVLHYNSILCFCNPRNIYRKNTESNESTKNLTLEIFRLYGTYVMDNPRYDAPKLNPGPPFSVAVKNLSTYCFCASTIPFHIVT